ncbi:hypothetical protein [Sphingobacterium faecale]|uniref:Glycosyltransferase family 1 protein n=1 Tax=Sphingobacterium faecale TaxID=2803775 RepID=A0ABS1QZD6_9SPHI|nr:hypothetical protein [Sphingobacterium faecale]MBL1407807.1 hypothetical protein [Sphingobacterium faecale]
MRKKTIILCAPSDFGLFEAIKRGLEDLEYTVLGFPIEDGQYKYKNPISRVINTFRKVFLNDKEYKNKLKLKERSLFLNKELSKIKTADLALFIRPDMYPVDFIQKIQGITYKTTAYHWDSINRFPQVTKYLNLFNRFFVFDHEDYLLYPNTKLTTNFYFPNLSPAATNNKKTAYLLGSCDEDRLQQSILLKNKLEQLKYCCCFTLKTKKKREIELLKQNNISSINEAIPYDKNLSNVKESTLLIDLHNKRQSGLSFRAFESLNYSKKLITTNKHIAKYDFYHPNNIFIWDGENENQLEQFLDAELVEISSQIKIKYSLQNWLNYLFEEQPFIEIKAF